MNIDQSTNEAIELVSQGAKMTNQLILYVLKSVTEALEKNEKDTVIQGRQKISDLVEKHKDGIESLDGNITKVQLQDYQKELKKLGVDFSVVKNGKDNYSFFFASSQAGIIERGLKNVLENKSQVLNNEKVKEAELDLNAEKNNFPTDKINKVKEIYDKSSGQINEENKEIENLSDKEKILFNKMKRLDTVQKEVKESMNDPSKSKENKRNEVETSKDQSREILHERLSQLDNKELALFEKRIEYENLSTSPVVDSRKAYDKADELKKLQNRYPKETVQKINNLDREIRDPNNFGERSEGNKLNANEILNETYKHKVERNNEKLKFSISNVKSIDQDIKRDEIRKDKVKNVEHSL